MALDSFNAYHGYRKSIEPLNDAERGRLFTALLEYSMTGEMPELRGNERFIFPTMADQIDRDKAKYDAKCANNKRSAGMRWDANAYERILEDANHAKDNNKDKDKDKDKDNNKDNGKNIKAFSPPSVDDVRAYCLERNNGIDAEAFVAYYENRDWKVGKSKMKDWHLAIVTWEKNGYNQQKPSKPSMFPSMDYGDTSEKQRQMAKMLERMQNKE